MRQATVNLLADMGIQPGNLQTAMSLTAASASSDATRPVSAVTAPAPNSIVSGGNTMTVTGTASDTGGKVGGVEVSVDGGATWHPAVGREQWTYEWTPIAEGQAVIKSRAVDDSGNIEDLVTKDPVTTEHVTVTPQAIQNGPWCILQTATNTAFYKL